MPPEDNPADDVQPTREEMDDTWCPHCQDGDVVAADGSKTDCPKCGGTGYRCPEMMM